MNKCSCGGVLPEAVFVYVCMCGKMWCFDNNYFVEVEINEIGELVSKGRFVPGPEEGGS